MGDGDGWGRTTGMAELVTATEELAASGGSVPDLLWGLVREVVERLPAALAWVGRVDTRDQSIRISAWAGSGWVYLDHLEVSARNESRGRGPAGTATRTDRTDVSNDIARDPRMGPWREAAMTLGYRSMAAIPLHLGESAPGTLNVYAVETDFFDDETIVGLETVAGLVSRAAAP